MERIEKVRVVFEEDEHDAQFMAYEEGVPVDINDPRLHSEQVWIDPAADAYARAVTLNIAVDGRGIMAKSVSVDWVP